LRDKIGRGGDKQLVQRCEFHRFENRRRSKFQLDEERLILRLW